MSPFVSSQILVKPVSASATCSAGPHTISNCYCPGMGCSVVKGLYVLLLFIEIFQRGREMTFMMLFGSHWQWGDMEPFIPATRKKTKPPGRDFSWNIVGVEIPRPWQLVRSWGVSGHAAPEEIFWKGSADTDVCAGKITLWICNKSSETFILRIRRTASPRGRCGTPFSTVPGIVKNVFQGDVPFSQFWTPAPQKISIFHLQAS